MTKYDLVIPPGVQKALGVSDWNNTPAKAAGLVQTGTSAHLFSLPTGPSVCGSLQGEKIGLDAQSYFHLFQPLAKGCRVRRGTFHGAGKRDIRVDSGRTR